MKGIWIETESGPIHADLTDDAIEEDIDKIRKLIKRLRLADAQKQKDFDQLWANDSRQVGDGLKDLAFHWFGIGYDLAQQRKK